MTSLPLPRLLLGVSLVVITAACDPDRGDTDGFWEDAFNSLRVENAGPGAGAFRWRWDAAEGQTPSTFTQLRTTESAQACPTTGRNVKFTASGPGASRVGVTNDTERPCVTGDELALDYESAKPLLESVVCLKSGAAGATPATAPALPSIQTCDHGVAAQPAQTDQWVKVLVPAPAELATFTLTDCAQVTTQLTLFDESGTTELANVSGDGGAGSSCPSLNHEVQSNQTYLLRIRAQSPAPKNIFLTYDLSVFLI